MKGRTYLLWICCCLLGSNTWSQDVKKDTGIVLPNPKGAKNSFATKKDSVMFASKNGSVKEVYKHSPKKATLHSLMVPGWGQIYNKEYWKLPIVYGALGAAAGFYIYNNNWYKKTRNAYEIKVANDTARFGEIDPKLEPIPAPYLIVYRNSFRRDRDYSALWFIIFWGLNVADATVFAHLKNFDVSSDLSLNIQPIISQGGTNGVNLVLSYKKPKPRIFDVR